MKREPAEPQGFIKLTGVGIPRLQAGEDVKDKNLEQLLPMAAHAVRSDREGGTPELRPMLDLCKKRRKKY